MAQGVTTTAKGRGAEDLAVPKAHTQTITMRFLRRSTLRALTLVIYVTEIQRSPCNALGLPRRRRRQQLLLLRQVRRRQICRVVQAVLRIIQR